MAFPIETCQHDPIFSGNDHTSRLGVHLADRSCHCGDLSLREEALPGAKGIVLPSENVNPQEVHLPQVIQGIGRLCKGTTPKPGFGVPNFEKSLTLADVRGVHHCKSSLGDAVL